MRKLRRLFTLACAASVAWNFLRIVSEEMQQDLSGEFYFKTPA